MWGGGWWHQTGVLCPCLPLVGRPAYRSLVGGHNSLVPLSLAWVSISGMQAGYIIILAPTGLGNEPHVLGNGPHVLGNEPHMC